MNPEQGDTAVCGAPEAIAAVVGQPGAERVALAAPVETRTHLESLLRTLSRCPNIGHVVLCGDDTRAGAEALLALWADGLDGDGFIAGPRGWLADDLDSAVLGALREDVAVTDLRGDHASVVVDAIGALPDHDGGRESVLLLAPAVPARKAFLSRRTSFPIFSSDVADSWLQLLNLTLRVGVDKCAADGSANAEALNAVVTIDAPLLEDGEYAEGDEFPAYLDFNREDYEGRFHSPYLARLLADGGQEQLDEICALLKDAPDTRRATLKLPNGSASFNVVEGRLFGSFVLDSCEVYTDWPMEATALFRFHRFVATRVGVEAGATTFMIHATYLHQDDFGRAGRVLGQHFKRPLPLHVDPSGVFLFGSDKDGARAMLLNHDASEILWEDAFLDPEDLSWYIVDVMPWLAPQHIRYVGQECAALMAAMNAGECYLQG